MFDRRTVAVAAPGLAVPKSSRQKSAFYSGVGNELTRYEVDVAAATLAKGGSHMTPDGIDFVGNSKISSF